MTRQSTAVAILLLILPALGAAAQVTRNVDYLPDRDYADGRDLLDVHMPDRADNVPVIVYFHGGGLLFGDKSLGDPVAERLLPMGIGLVSANYRLSPAVQHPAHVQDAAAAFAWAAGNIADYGGDPESLYVAGHSAGAYLAALLAVDPDHLTDQGISPARLRGAIPISPFLYVEETAPERPMTVWGTNPDDWLAASVTPHIGPNRPPMLLLYADGDDDWRRAQNERFAAAMQVAGNDVRAEELPGRDHRSIIDKINAPDDQVGRRIRTFIFPSAD
ncbi:MAG: alpha/beta hydrolase [Pseudomonadales bacterium]